MDEKKIAAALRLMADAFDPQTMGELEINIPDTDAITDVTPTPTPFSESVPPPEDFKLEPSPGPEPAAATVTPIGAASMYTAAPAIPAEDKTLPPVADDAEKKQTLFGLLQKASSVPGQENTAPDLLARYGMTRFSEVVPDMLDAMIEEATALVSAHG